MMCDRNTPTKFRLSLDLHENRSHDSLQTAPTSCPELNEVQHDLSLYGCGKIIVLNDFCVLFAVPSPLMLLSAIPPTVRTLLPYWRATGDTDFLRNGGQSADNPDFTVYIIRCVYRAELILGR